MNKQEINDYADKVADCIASSSHYDKHVVEQQEFQDGKFGIPIDVTTREDYKNHIKETLTNEKTECFQVTDGFEKGTSHFYNSDTNTYIAIPGDANFEPTAYRPEQFRDKFKVKHERTMDEQGNKAEIKHGIHELHDNQVVTPAVVASMKANSLPPPPPPPQQSMDPPTMSR